MNKKYYKTDITDKEVSDAANKLIKNYKSNHCEILYENDFELINDSKHCLYCNVYHDEKKTIITDNFTIGYFCSNFCKSIYYFLLSQIFNLPLIITEIMHFIPFNLLSKKSKIHFHKIKNQISQYDYIKINNVIEYNSNYIICNMKIITNDDIINKNIKFEYIENSNTCIFCNSDTIDINLILETKFSNITGFCSYICMDSICKQLYSTLLPELKYNSYIIPLQLVRDKDKLINVINKIKNKNLLGGMVTCYKNIIKIELFVPK
jgi:hypothetical protein